MIRKLDKVKRTWISRKGIRILRKVQRAILANPAKYRQDTWHCGTAMCIAGHVCFEAGVVTGVRTSRWDDACPVLKNGDVGVSNAWSDIAEQALELGPQVNKFVLFEDPKADVAETNATWPDEFRSMWFEAKTRKERAIIASKRIEYFIQEGL